MIIEPQSGDRDVFIQPTELPLAEAARWIEAARGSGARDPGAFTLATADFRGRTSSRVVQSLSLKEEGLVFASHSGSRKGRDLASNPWASAVFFWGELGRQLILCGPTHMLSAAESDDLWSARPAAARPMSVVSSQSSPLDDEGALRQAAAQVSAQAHPVARPPGWVGYRIVPFGVEFWQSAPDRLHRRLSYELRAGRWRAQRLQP